MSSITSIWNALRDFYEARHEPENMRPLAEWYWRTMLMFALVMTVAILAYGIWEFIGVIRALGVGDANGPARTRELLSKKDLADMIAAYEARQSAFQEIQATQVPARDPSL